MAIMDQIKAKGTPHFVWIFDAFINQNSRNSFRTWVNYKIEPPVYLEYAKARNPKRVAILYVYLPHAHEEFTQLVIPRLKEMGVEDIYAEPYDMGLKDYKDIAVKVKHFCRNFINQPLLFPDQPLQTAAGTIIENAPHQLILNSQIPRHWIMGERPL